MTDPLIKGENLPLEKSFSFSSPFDIVNKCLVLDAKLIDPAKLEKGIVKMTQIDFHFPIGDNSPIRLTDKVPIDNYFPEDEANELAQRESFNKHLFRPNTYLHKWWARRSGTTFRYILKQLVPNQHLRDYYQPGGLESVTILDPMMGGGTTLHEAIRMGANVIGYDIDPIPILQAKASLDNIDIFKKKSVFYDFYNELKQKLSTYFQTNCPICDKRVESQFILYGIRKKINEEEVIVIDSSILRVESNNEYVTIDDLYPLRQVGLEGISWKIIDKQSAKDQGVNGKLSDILELSLPERYVPLVVTGSCDAHGGFFKKIEAIDLKSIKDAYKYAATLELPSSELFTIPRGPKSDDLINRNVLSFCKLFFPRQLIYLNESKKLFDSISEEHRFWMSLLISTSMEFNSLLCGYKGAEKRRPGAIRHVFAHHAYSFPYTALENNPVYSKGTSGTLSRLFQSRIAAASKWASAPVERKYVGGKWKKTTIFDESDVGYECSSIREFIGQKKRYLVKQNDSSRIPQPDGCIDFVVTDPPYFDSVQYSDLSHFFRCWLRWFLPNDAHWDYLITSSAVAETSQNEWKFGDVLTRIWQECNRVLARPHGRLIFTYHHWRASAWTQLSIALSKAQFRLVNAYIVHAENLMSVHITNLKALKHDAILILKPSDELDEKCWQKPSTISLEDSYSFCRGCAAALGWVLDCELSAEVIAEVWDDLLGVR